MKASNIPISFLHTEIFKNSSHPIFLLNTDDPFFTVLDANQSFLDISNRKVTELIGKGIFEVFPENPENTNTLNQHSIRAALYGIIEGKPKDVVDEFRYDIQSEDKSAFLTRYWQTTLSPIKDKTGKVQFILVEPVDITQRTQAENKLKNSESRLRKLFHEAPFSMAIAKGKHHKIQKANKLYLELTERTSDIIGKTVAEVFPELKDQNFYEWLDMVYETGNTFHGNEVPLSVKKAGEDTLTTRYINFVYQSYTDETGEIAGIFYFGYDVTAQVEARKTIEENEKRFTDLIHNLPVALYTTNLEGDLKIYNKAALDLWGGEPSPKAKWIGVDHVFSPVGKMLKNNETPIAQSVKLRKNIRDREVIYKKQNGDLVNILPYPSPIIDSNGEMIGAMNILVDITKSKKVEQDLRVLSLIAKETNNSVILTDKKGVVVWVNEAYLNTSGYTEEEILNKKYTAIIQHQSTDQTIVDSISDYISKGKIFELEFLKTKKNGSQYWVDIMGRPIMNEKGEYTHYFQIEFDLTLMKLAYEKVLKSENESRRFATQLNEILEAERSRIAREIHDEFGQLLTGIKMSLATLKKTTEKPEETNKINDLMVEVDLSISSLRSLASDLRPRILDTLGLGPSLEWLVNDVQKKSGIRSSVFIDVDETPIDQMTAICFYRICQEALTNVLKHSEANKLSVRLIQNKDTLSLEVSDNGIGLNYDKREPHFSNGILGMRERALMLGAFFEIDSQPKKGTTLRVTLKIKRNEKNINSR
ncbi:MAG: PAS domain S-box protein [Bacteroidetes bacterium]|nr:PAS domain S-box protein [Bacteroidota bacterium]